MSRRAAVCLTAALAASAFFIFDHLGARALWVDEAGTAAVVSRGFGHLAASAAVDGCPLLYAFLLKLWTLAFGDAETALRGFSAVFGVATVALLAAAARELFDDEASAVCAAILGATNYFLIFFSGQAKAYTVSAFAGLLSQTLFFRAARRGGRRDRAGYLAASAASLYLHPWLFFVFGSQIAAAFAFRRTCARYPALVRTQALAFLLALPNAAVTLYQGSLHANDWMPRPGAAALAEAFRYMTYGSSAIAAAAAVAALALWRFGRLPKEPPSERRRFAAAALALYLAVPLVSGWAISQVSRAYVPGRYEMIVLPAFLLILARIGSVFRRWMPAGALAAALLAGSAWRSVGDDRRTIAAYRSTDKAVVQQLLGKMEKGDAVVAAGLSYATASYYFRRLDPAQRFEIAAYPAETAVHPSWLDVRRMRRDPEVYRREARRLAAALHPPSADRTVWVLYRSGDPFHETLRGALRETFLLEDAETLPVPREPSWFDQILRFRH